MDKWFDFFSSNTKKDLDASLKDVSLRGLAAKLGEHSILKLARELFNESKKFLEKDIETQHEVQFLKPMQDIIDIGLSPAEQELKAIQKRC